MIKSDNKSSLILLMFFSLSWGLILVKTIFVSAYETENFFFSFYGIMLDSTWQSHFNVDLFLFSILFAGWAIYREKSLLTGIAVGIFSILLGGVFSLLHLNICAIGINGDLYLLVNGKKCKSEL